MTERTPEGRFSIGELADQAGVSRRAVRFYVQEGLLPGPIGLGRGAYYTAEHAALLARIRDLQALGLGLAAVRRHLAGDAPAPRAGASPEPEALAQQAPAQVATSAAWTRLPVADGVELHVRGDVLARVPHALVVHLTRELAAYVGRPPPDEP